MNKPRGENIVTIGGVDHVVTLNLATLAELESAFGAESFEEVLRAAKVSARWVIRFVRALMIGNKIPVTDLTEAAIGELDFVGMQALIAQLTGLVKRSALTAVTAAEGKDAERPLAARSVGKRG